MTNLQINKLIAKPLNYIFDETKRIVPLKSK